MRNFKYVLILSFALCAISIASSYAEETIPPTPAPAAPVQVDLVLSKTLTPANYELPDAIYKQCNFTLNDYTFGIQILRQFGKIKTQEFRPLRISNANEIDQYVTEAQKGPIRTVPGMAGVSSLSYVVIRKLPSGTTQYIDLKADGQLTTRNDSTAAAWLIQLIDLHCPN